MMAGTAILSAFISNTGTVATLMPAVVIAAWGVRSNPSAFLIPLAFAANAGGVLTLTGTPPNVVVAEALESHGFRPFDYFEYARIGLPLLLTAIVYMALFGKRLLPERTTGEAPQPLEGALEDLAETYALEAETYRLHVLAGSRLVGATLRDQQTAEYFASDAEDGDHFGYAIAMSGDTAIVGARAEDENGANAGAAYILERDGTGGWAGVKKLVASNGQSLDFFGGGLTVMNDHEACRL